MKKTFKSKVSLVILIPLVIILGSILVMMIINNIYSGAGITALVGLLIAWLFLDTSYIILPGNILRIKAGFLVNLKIDIASIKSIKSTNSIMSAPALSLDRIEIRYNKYDSVVISPAKKEEFIAELIKINPLINTATF